jgi:hypothetical protein
MRVCACICGMYTHVENRRKPQALFSEMQAIFLETRSLLDTISHWPGAHCLAYWLTSKSQRYTCLCFPSTLMTNVFLQAWPFNVSSGDQTRVLKLAKQASSSPIPYSWPRALFFKSIYRNKNFIEHESGYKMTTEPEATFLLVFLTALQGIFCDKSRTLCNIQSSWGGNISRILKYDPVTIVNTTA